MPLFPAREVVPPGPWKGPKCEATQVVSLEHGGAHFSMLYDAVA